jgi:hypothetical protein
LIIVEARVSYVNSFSRRGTLRSDPHDFHSSVQIKPYRPRNGTLLWPTDLPSTVEILNECAWSDSSDRDLTIPVTSIRSATQQPHSGHLKKIQRHQTIILLTANRGSAARSTVEHGQSTAKLAG